MKKENSIKIGDKVNVHFTCSESIYNGTIIRMPDNENKYWVVKTEMDVEEHIHYVQTFEKIVLTKDEEARRNELRKHMVHFQ